MTGPQSPSWRSRSPERLAEWLNTELSGFAADEAEVNEAARNDLTGSDLTGSDLTRGDLTRGDLTLRAAAPWREDRHGPLTGTSRLFTSGFVSEAFVCREGRVWRGVLLPQLTLRDQPAPLSLQSLGDPGLSPQTRSALRAQLACAALGLTLPELGEPGPITPGTEPLPLPGRVLDDWSPELRTPHAQWTLGVINDLSDQLRSCLARHESAPRLGLQTGGDLDAWRARHPELGEDLRRVLVSFSPRHETIGGVSTNYERRWPALLRGLTEHAPAQQWAQWAPLRLAAQLSDERRWTLALQADPRLNMSWWIMAFVRRREDPGRTQSWVTALIRQVEQGSWKPWADTERMLDQAPRLEHASDVIFEASRRSLSGAERAACEQVWQLSRALRAAAADRNTGAAPQGPPRPGPDTALAFRSRIGRLDHDLLEQLTALLSTPPTLAGEIGPETPDLTLRRLRLTWAPEWIVRGERRTDSWSGPGISLSRTLARLTDSGRRR